MKRFVDLYADEGSKHYNKHELTYIGKINVSNIAIICSGRYSIAVYSNATSDFTGKSYRLIIMPALSVGGIKYPYYISESDACALENDND